MEAMEPAWSTPVLLLIAAAAVAVLLFLIIVVRMHAFLALVLVSILTALAARFPLADVPDVLLYGFADTLGEVALLVGLGAMLGRLLEVSGGAQALADTLIGRFGERRAPFALGVASLLSGAFAAMHAIVPPHPGPVTAADQIGADVGLTLLIGLPVAAVTWYVGSYLFSKVVAPKVQVDVPTMLLGEENGGREEPHPNPASFGTVLGLLLLPLVLIAMNTVASTLTTTGVLSEDSTLAATLVLIGQTPIALLITVLVASYVLGLRAGRTRDEVQRLVDGALGPICAIILITGAGGMFGGVLELSGIGEALSSSLEDIGLPLIVSAFVIATLLRVAQGSATVALVTTAGLIAPGVEAADPSQVQLVALVFAIAAGATVLSHVNDSGFWLVSRFFQMDEKTTLKTWTVMETTIGLTAFVLACLLWLVA